MDAPAVSRQESAASPAGRLTWLWTTLVGVAALWVAERGLPLVAAPSCPGLADAASAVVLRQWPRLTLGALFGWSHRAALVAAVATFVASARALGISWPTAALAGIALAAGPVLAPSFSPPTAIVAFACCAGLARALALGDGRGEALASASRGTGGYTDQQLAYSRPWAWAFFAALVTPALGTLAALVAGVATWPAGKAPAPSSRRRKTLAAILLVVMAAVFTSILARSATAAAATAAPAIRCVLPESQALSRSHWLAATRHAAAIAGPALLLCALVSLVSRRWRPRVAVPGVLAVVGALALQPPSSANAVAANWLSQPASSTLMPVLLVAWLLAAASVDAGLASLRARWRPVAIVLALALGVWLQRTRAESLAGDARVWPRGHDGLSYRSLAQALTLLPARVVILDEDAGTDLLLSVVRAGRLGPPGESALLAPRSPGSVAAALREGTTVLALPTAQGAIQRRGLTWEPVRVPASATARSARAVLQGMAQVTGAHACTSLDARWNRLPQELLMPNTPGDGGTPDTTIAVDWDQAPDARVQFYLAGSSALSPEPRAWPERARRGFWRGTSDMSVAELAESMRREMKADGFYPANHAEVKPFLTRVEVWRTPGAPLSLSVSVGGSPQRAWARVLTSRPGGLVDVCPSSNREPLVFGR